MTNLYDYNRTTAEKLCEIGRKLRARAVMQSEYIRNDAWTRENTTSLGQTHVANSRLYLEAFGAWQKHYQCCSICQAALKP